MANQKGGVGKTTTTVSLGVALARMGHRVLLVDFDPQANATGSLGFDVRALSRHVYDVLAGEAGMSEAVLESSQAHLSLLPSHPDLAGAEVELAAVDRRALVLRDSLTADGLQFEVTLIDCPPSLSVLTLNALVAATAGVIIPVQCEYLALEGLSRLVQTVATVRSGLNPGLSILGIVMTMYDVRTNLSAEVVQEVHKHFPGVVFRDAIPRSVRLSEAPSRGQSIFEYAPQSAGALAYRSVAGELAVRLGLTAS
ncbi:MAG: ParA family protein [Anaerolineae bacterium]